MKLKWKVGEKPTGRYKSFQKRSWPMAEYPDGKMAVMLQPVGDEDYRPRLKEEVLLKIYVADHVLGTFHWRLLKSQQRGLTKAKAAAGLFINANHERLLDHAVSLAPRK